MCRMMITVASAPPPSLLELQDGVEAGPEPHPRRSTRTDSKYLQEVKIDESQRRKSKAWKCQMKTSHPRDTRQLGFDSGQLSRKSDEGRNCSQLFKSKRWLKL